MSEAQTVPEWDLADRMRKALRVSGASVAAMADYLGVAPETVSTWINGRHRPSPATVRLWAMRCEVPYEWLLGDGVRTAPIRSQDDGDPYAGLCYLCVDTSAPAHCYGSDPWCACYCGSDDLDTEALSLCRSVLGLAA